MSQPTDLPRAMVIRPAMWRDLHDVLKLRQAQELAENGTITTTVDRLAADWDALGPGLAEHVWVAVATDGRILACGELMRNDQVFHPCLWALPDHHDSGIEMALLASAEEQARAVGRVEGAASITLFAQATSTQQAAQRALLRSGYAITSTYEKMERALSEPPPTPDSIVGTTIRSFSADEDAELAYRADEEAFLDERGHTPRTFARWLQRMTLGEAARDPTLWQIAWAADEIAGAAFGEIITGVGWIHHLGVRRPWRRCGLGAALMLAALDAFYQRGVATVRLNVDAQSLTHAQLLYRRLGFRVTGAYSNYQKILSLE